MTDKQMLADKIMEYYEQVLKKNQAKFCPNEEADRLVRENPVAFVFAVIMDQGGHTLH